MRRWFLSYNSRDFATTQALQAALSRTDPGAHIFLAKASLRAGGYWLPQLSEEIAAATIFVLVVGEHGLGPWQADEYYEARDRRIPIVVVLLEGQAAPGLPMLRQLHWIVTSDLTSQATLGQLMEAAEGGGPLAGERWKYTKPYRGLPAMRQEDSDFFFGRLGKTIEAVTVLEATPNKVAVLLGNSGVGKSSLANAGVVSCLRRQAWPDSAQATIPKLFRDSRRWCYLEARPGSEPLRNLVQPFLRAWQIDATDPLSAKRQAEWVTALHNGSLGLRDLLDATERRFAELHEPSPPAFFLYIDQGEELYVHAKEERHQRRFSEVLAEGAGDVRLRVMASLRSDFFGELQKDEALHAVHRPIDVPPLREGELREVVSRPPELLGAKFETERLAATIARRTAEESVKDAGALPLLSYLLDDMWTQMIERNDGVLRAPEQAFDLGGVLVARANAFIADHPRSEDVLRRIFTLKLATVREDSEPTRRSAARSEFSDDEWRLVTELADDPNRLLVTVTREGGASYAEVAHEAIFRRWDKAQNWITMEREFLIWKGALEADRRRWEATDEKLKDGTLLMGLSLAQAQGWLASRSMDLAAADREFIERSIAREKKARTRVRRVQIAALLLLASVIAGLVGWINQSSIVAEWKWMTVTRPFIRAQVQPYALGQEAEAALKPKDVFKECADEQGKDQCPVMVVVPPGSFMMGSSPKENGHAENEGPQHQVTIAKPFAVSKFLLTFDEWDTCVEFGDCRGDVSDAGWGHGQRPVINITWTDARRYVTWLAKITGKPYRLLTEAEYEYVARGGTKTAYPWGDEVGIGNASCNGCGSEWDNARTAPVGSFAPNQFGLYDMVGNVFQWTQDCYHPDYNGAPTDGSEWVSACPDEDERTVRAGGKNSSPRFIRVASRRPWSIKGLVASLGFRVARTLKP